MTSPIAPSPRWKSAGFAAAGLCACLLGLLVPRAADTSDFSPVLIRLAVATGVVVALGAIAVRLFGRQLTPAPLNSTELELLEVVPVGGHCRVHLVRAGDQLLLAGLDAGGLKWLIALPDEFPE